MTNSTRNGQAKRDRYYGKTKTTIRKRLVGLHESGQSWREIAEREEYIGIPFGTLNAIGNGADVPKKWRSRLGMVSEGARRYRALNEKAKAAGWGSWSEYQRAVLRSEVELCGR